jgi:hypothetical protein
MCVAQLAVYCQHKGAVHAGCCITHHPNRGWNSTQSVAGSTDPRIMPQVPEGAAAGSGGWHHAPPTVGKLYVMQDPQVHVCSELTLQLERRLWRCQPNNRKRGCSYMPCKRLCWHAMEAAWQLPAGGQTSCGAGDNRSAAHIDKVRSGLHPALLTRLGRART